VSGYDADFEQAADRGSADLTSLAVLLMPMGWHVESGHRYRRVEIPSDVSGRAKVTVTHGGESASTSLSVQTRQPGFFLFPNNHVAAVRADGSYIGPANLVDVPDLPEGDHAVIAETGGVWTQAFAKLRIQR
jgi:hypothetical protein